MVVMALFICLVVGWLVAGVTRVPGPGVSCHPTGQPGIFHVVAVRGFQRQQEKVSLNVEALFKPLLASHLLITH